ncbi:MAG: hypothetical protein HYR73_08895 [Candidatus Eisenbacteria bacterium]|nr:hypothetical protein [Candidatus Eisenbacteria bacterium]
MSATDDAGASIPSADPSRSHRRGLGPWLTLYGAFAGALLACAFLAAPGVLPSIPRYASRVRSGSGMIEVRAASRNELRERTALLLGAADGSANLARRRIADRRAEWAAGPLGPLAALAPESRCAALLRARSEIGRTLVGESATATPSEGSAALERADRAVEEAVLAGRPDGLRELLGAADRAEAEWIAAEPVAAERLARWRSRERDRAEQFELGAQGIESAVTALQRDLIRQWLPEFALELEPSASATLEAAAGGGAATAPRPLAMPWALAALLGSFAGGVTGFVLERRVPRSHHPDRAARIVREARVAGASDARLHIVSAKDALGIAAAACDIAAPFLAREERVLVIDAGRGLELHTRFGCRARGGLSDCVRGELPLLGAVQSVGIHRFYLLASGAGAPGPWPDAARVVDEGLAHFARVIVAVDRMAPHACGDALRGRVLEGWWPHSASGHVSGAETLSARLGIALQAFALSPASERLLEALPETIRSMNAAVPRGESGAAHDQPRAPTPHVTALAPDPEEPALLEVARPSPDDPALRRKLREAMERRGPGVLGSDARMRERLRFLMWMRRVQSESRKSEATRIA